MAKSGSKRPSDLRESSKKRRGLFVQDPSEWKKVLEMRGLSHIKITGQSRISMCCPFHDESHPSAHIYLDRKLFRCYAGSCNAYYTDPILFLQKLLNITYQTAAEEFKRNFSATAALRPDDIVFFSEEATRFRRMRLLSEAFHTHLVNAWPRTDLPEGAKATIIYLKSTRNVSDISSITSMGLFPTAAELKTPGFFKGDKADLEWATGFLSKFFYYQYQDNIVFTYAISPDEITAFKLRHPATKEVITIKDEKDPMGFFGLINPGYKELYNDEKFQQSMVVEGEFDQISIFSNQVTLGAFNEVVLGASGGSNISLDYLADIGLTQSRIVADDDLGGKSFTLGLLKKTKTVACEIFEWDDGLRQQGVVLDPDNAIQLHGFNKIYARLSSDGSYTYPPRWCKERVVEELVNVNDEDVRKQEEVAIKYGSLLNHESELDAFCSLLVLDYPLLTAPGLIKHIRKSDDSDEGMAHNMAGWLRRKLHVVYVDSSENHLHLWSKGKRAKVILNLNSNRATISVIRRHIPGTMVAWARDEIGFPSSYPPIEATEDEKGKYDWVRDQVSKRLEDAIGLISADAPEKPFAFLSQGMHLKEVADAGTPGYLVNGDTVYKMQWDQEGAHLLSAVKLEGPSDGTRVFDLEIRPQIAIENNGAWHPDLRKSEDFFQRPKHTLRQCYDLVFEIINTVSEFKYQTSDAQYCSLLIFYSYLIDSMQRRVMTHLLGEYESGKSSCLSIISKSQQLPEYNLTYHATTLDQYTIASLFQGFVGTTLQIGLDEANDTGEEYNNKIRTLLEKMRGLSTKGIADRNIGSTNQKAKMQFLYNSIVTASATEIHDDMDFSRFNTIQLVKNTNKANTRLLLSQKFGASLFADLRQSIFLNVVQIVPKIARAYKELPAEFSDGEKHKLNRAVEGLMPLAAIAKTIGLDHSSFILEFCSNREEAHHTRKISRDGFELLDKLLNSARLKILLPGTDETKDMTILSALKTKPLREAVNDSEAGVFFDEKERCLGVNWDQVLLGLLIGTKYQRHNAATLKNIANQTKFHVDREVAKQSGLLARLMAKGLAGSTHFSFFTLQERIKEIEDANMDSQSVEDDETQVSELSKSESGMNL